MEDESQEPTYVKTFLYYFLIFRQMVLPGFTAKRSLSRALQSKFGLIYTHNSTSASAMPSALCEYYRPGSIKMCGAAGYRGDDFLICMCQCHPECFSDLP
jgi:hypothetical protein